MNDTIRLPVRLEIATLASFKEELLAISPIPPKVTLDCSDLNFISAAGAQLLLAFITMLRANDTMFSLNNLNDDVKYDLTLLGLHELTEELT